MARNFLAGVATVDMMVGNQIIASARTLIDSSINIGSSVEEIRGGMGNKLFGKFYHTSTFDISLTDVMFKLEYFAFNTGSTISNGADIFHTEQVVIQNNLGTISNVPLRYQNYGTIGWVSIPNTDNPPTTVTFQNQQFQYQVPDGTTVCVKYMMNNAAGRNIVINSNFIPSEVKLVMTANLYRAGSSTSVNVNSSSKSGFVQIIVPRFQFSGSQEFSMTASGYSTSPINGSALDVESDDCAEGGYYAIINEVLTSATWYDDVYALALDDSELSLTVDEGPNHTRLLTVYAIPRNGQAFPAPLGGEDGVMFTIGNSAVASVDEKGLVTGLTAGNTTIVAALTRKTEISAVADVVVA